MVVMEPVLLMALFLVICLKAFNGNSGALATQECGVLVNSTLKSRGYPFTYPADMDCEYSVPIPPGGPMEIYFVDFDVEFHPSCSYDFVKIGNDQNYTFGKYCGRRTGQTVVVYGNFALVTFHSDFVVKKRGFFFRFKTVLAVPPKISLPAVVEALPGYRVKIPVTGTPPIYTAIIRDSTVLVNTTYTAAFQFYNGSNYTSVAFNKYGYDTRDFTVISRDCGHACSPRFNSRIRNELFCENVTATQLKMCLSPLTETFVASSLAGKKVRFKAKNGAIREYLMESSPT